MNLPRGIGDPIELTRRMAARGLIKYPNPATVALEVAIVEMHQLKEQPHYQTARVRDQAQGLPEKTIANKKRAMRRIPLSL
jgi:hypothetical protein